MLILADLPTDIPPPRKQKFFMPLSVLFFILFIGMVGCSSFNTGLDKTTQKELIELKKKYFTQLRSDLASKAITLGTNSEKIRERYGEPDDKFSSGSTSSHSEIWTYEKVMVKESLESANPIRLYFENNKLISWNY